MTQSPRISREPTTVFASPKLLHFQSDYLQFNSCMHQGIDLRLNYVGWFSGLWKSKPMKYQLNSGKQKNVILLLIIPNCDRIVEIYDVNILKKRDRSSCCLLISEH